MQGLVRICSTSVDGLDHDKIRSSVVPAVRLSVRTLFISDDRRRKCSVIVVHWPTRKDDFVNRGRWDWMWSRAQRRYDNMELARLTCACGGSMYYATIAFPLCKQTPCLMNEVASQPKPLRSFTTPDISNKSTVSDSSLNQHNALYNHVIPFKLRRDPSVPAAPESGHRRNRCYPGKVRARSFPRVARFPLALLLV